MAQKITQVTFGKARLALACRLVLSCAAMYGACLAVPAAAAIDPLQVNDLIGQAVQTHPLVGSAIADEKAAAEGVTAAKLSLLPTPSISTTHDSQNGIVANATIRQPLWTGGRLTANINQAIYDEKAATAYIFEQQNTVAKNTIDIWQSYIYAIALQNLYLQNLRQLADFEAMMNRRVSQGASAKIELDLVRNRILQDQNAFQGAQEQQRIAEARLEQLIGEQLSPASAAVPMTLLAQYAKEQSKNFGELAFGDASETNPSVIRQKFQVESARQSYKAQRASSYPTVYAQYSHNYYIEEKRNKGDFSLGMSYDPGAGFSNMALSRASEARVQSLLQSQEAARRTAMENIQTAYQQFVSARDQELSLNAATAGASIVVASYQRQFIAGRKSWLEVLNAVREESQYRQQLLQVQSQMVASFYKLQVDFGIMPWQQQNNSNMTTPVKEFRPLIELADWVKNRRDAWTTDKEPTLGISQDDMQDGSYDDGMGNVISNRAVPLTNTQSAQSAQNSQSPNLQALNSQALNSQNLGSQALSSQNLTLQNSGAAAGSSGFVLTTSPLTTNPSTNKTTP